MKVCITSTGKELDSEIDPRFGRCSFFIFVDTDTMQYEAVENPWREASGGVGIQAAQFVIQKGTKKIITGRVGANAEMVLRKAGIEIVEGIGRISEIIKKFK